MNSAQDLLQKTAELGISITARSGKLKVIAPKGVVTAKLKTELAENKSQIIRLLAPQRQTTSVSVYEVVVDGRSVTVIDPLSEPFEVFAKSVKGRFGSGRVEQIKQKF